MILKPCTAEFSRPLPLGTRPAVDQNCSLMRLVLKLLWEKLFSEEFQTFPFDHQVIVEPAIMLAEASIEFHEPTVRPELQTLWDVVAVLLFPSGRKLAHGKWYFVDSSVDGIDDYQLATTGRNPNAGPCSVRKIPRWIQRLGESSFGTCAGLYLRSAPPAFRGKYVELDSLEILDALYYPGVQMPIRAARKARKGLALA